MKYSEKIKKCCLFFVVLFTLYNSQAQRKHFIYFQAEDKQPFYITINNKNYSSTVNGHLVIPRLKNGKYFFVAGFPKDKFPEQKFTCVIADKDLGFVLKQFGTDGWGLFNLITFSKTMANNADWEKDKSSNDTVKIDDDYVLAPVNNTSKEVVATGVDTQEKEINETKNVETIETNPIVKTTVDSVQSSSNQAITEVHTNEKKLTDLTTTTKIVKTYQKGGAQGVEEVYVDYSTSPQDTISIFIPSGDESNSIVAPSVQNKAADSTKNVMPGNTSQYNTACVHMAEEADFAKSRKQMSQETTDDKMIATAKKSFSNKCFYVEQIKNLGLLFISEQNKLKFFNMSKPFIYDRLNFASLETQFTLSSVVEQFRKIIF